MFAVIKELLEEFVEDIKARDAERQARIEALCRDDDIARETEWGPAQGGGASFRTHKLSTITPDRVAFKKPWSSRVDAGISVVVGIGMVVLGISIFISGDSDGLLLALCGLAFTSITVAVLRYTSKPKVFDRDQKLFWVGYGEPTSWSNTVRLKDVHAIQLVAEKIRSSSSSTRSSYYSYELNLVLKNSTRVGVVDHGSRDAIRSDAEQLGEFLGVPVWDMT